MAETVYRIKDWDERFENAMSRKVKTVTYIPFPIEQGSEHFVQMMASRDGAAAYGHFIAVVALAASMPVRGVLRRSGKSLTADSVAGRIGVPSALFRRSWDYLTSKECGWIECVELPEESNTKPISFDSESNADQSSTPAGYQQNNRTTDNSIVQNTTVQNTTTDNRGPEADVVGFQSRCAEETHCRKVLLRMEHNGKALFDKAAAEAMAKNVRCTDIRLRWASKATEDQMNAAKKGGKAVRNVAAYLRGLLEGEGGPPIRSTPYPNEITQQGES
jgi:hypothetical protein